MPLGLNVQYYSIHATPGAVESAPTSKRPARRRADDNIFKFGASFGRKRCAGSAHHPLCIPDRCRLLCA
eukprot:5036783-Prymnesium_polylepis.1